MVKIRYAELPAGLHVAAEPEGRGTVVYLLPGLTPAQRRAALIRVRSSARMGQGPRLPAFAMRRALLADWLRRTVRNGAAAMRGHPLLLLPPLIVLVSSAIVFMLVTFVTLTVPILRPDSGAPQLLPHVGVTGSQAARHQHPGGGSDPASSGGPAPSGSRGPRSSVPAASPTPSLSSLSGSPSPKPQPSSSAGTESPSPSTSDSASPSPSPSSSPNCLDLGLLGLCLNL